MNEENKIGRRKVIAGIGAGLATMMVTPALAVGK